jgi:hypothetical protein
MNRKTRYRRRLKLQRALASLYVVMNDHLADDILADETTVLLAAKVYRHIRAFIEGGGFDADRLSKDGGIASDNERLLYLLRSRWKETAARKSRRTKASENDSAPAEGSS